MEKETRTLIDIIVRYLILLLFAIGNLYIIYAIFRPLTLYPVYAILNTFYNITLSGITLLIEDKAIGITSACVAGSAYYLLLILNLGVSMGLRKRIYSLLYSFVVLLLFNILRIIILSVLIINNNSYFDITHKFLWFGLSTIFVVAIWFTEVRIFKIKQIPFYTDLKNIKKMIN